MFFSRQLFQQKFIWILGLHLWIIFGLSPHQQSAAETSHSSTQSPPSANELLKESDRSRGAVEESGGVTWKAHILSEERGMQTNIEYLIKVKGDNALAEALSPARNKGQLTLFNRRQVWFYKPGLKKPISVSARQKLSGQAANGDIASTQYARDYFGQIVGEDIINGIPTYRLKLKAQSKDITYDQIDYWISKEKKLGVKAEFLTLSGEVFKRASFEYKNHLTMGGRSYPFISKMIITDAKNPKNFTVLNYQNPQEDRHSLNIFNVNNIMR